MLIRDFGSVPFYASPANEGAPGGGVDDVVDDGGAADVADAPGGADDDSGEPAAPPSVRQVLDKAVADSKAKQAATDAAAAPVAKGKKKPTSSARQAGLIGDGQEPVDGAAPAVSDAPLPEGFSKELGADWGNTPPAVQQAIQKRVEDMNKGVVDLKSRYAAIDKAIEPHMDALRQMNAQPGDAVNRLFLWFKALANNPQAAFPALAASFNYDWAKLKDAAAYTGQMNRLGQQPGQEQQPGQQQQPQSGQQPGQPAPQDIPDGVKNYISGLEQRLDQFAQQFGGKFQTLESSMQREAETKTGEFLESWSKDKPHFEDVRTLMAQLIESGAIPLKDGKVDLDGSYDAAIFAHPQVRAKVLQERKDAEAKAAADKLAAERTAQNGLAGKARKAAVSLNNNAPGTNAGAVGRKAQKPAARKSVRDSIMEAVNEVNG